MIHYEAINLIVNCITSRFDQPIYCNIQDLLLKLANGDDYDTVIKFMTEFGNWL